MPIRIPDPSSGGIVRVTHFFDSGKCIIQLFCRNLFYTRCTLGFLEISNPTPLSPDLFCLGKRIVWPTHTSTLEWRGGEEGSVPILYGSEPAYSPYENFGTAFKIL